MWRRNRSCRCGPAAERGGWLAGAPAVVTDRALRWWGLALVAAGTYAYLYSDLTHDDRIAAEGAMIMLLDDPSPLVRHALAEALGSSRDAPPTVVHALINDQPDIATIGISGRRS